ncbi:MAG: hypothetical protein NT069_18510, partial [Planctomycetota bacterium]|nr:hypothetical protein [Planctomycetota bacterium]
RKLREMRPPRLLPAILLMTGGILFLGAGIVYLNARSAQTTEQERRDRHWLNVQRLAAKTFPRMLPGEEKPAPAPLPNIAWMIALGVAGVATEGLAVGLFVLSLRSHVVESRRSSSDAAS